MNARFRKPSRRQVLLPRVVREAGGAYGSDLHALGNTDILKRRKLALLCSVKCPGQLISDAYDLAQRIRAAGVTVVGGFHSPMERECLRILLQSPHAVVWCLARGLMNRAPTGPMDYRKAVADGRLVIVSPFAAAVGRITRESAEIRNRVVAGMAEAVVAVHATPGGSLERLCRELLAAGKPLYTFDHPANAALVAAGARSIRSLDLAAFGRGG